MQQGCGPGEYVCVAGYESSRWMSEEMKGYQKLDQWC
jgi:hypothetical protein